MEDNKSFSVVKFFRLFQEAVKKIDVFPLTAENIIVQEDAYKRLLSDKEDPDEPFASIGFLGGKSDTAVPFRIDFTSIGFIVMCEYYGVFSIAYEDSELFEDETDVVEQIIGFLTRLSNGQLGAIVTSYDGVPVAFETIIYDKDSKTPHITSTDTHFPRQTHAERLDFIVARNSFPISRLPIPKKAFYLDIQKNGELLPKGRTIEGAITPLTKQVFKQTFEDLVRDDFGQGHDESDAIFLLRSWTTWLCLPVVIGIIYCIYLLGYLPSIFIETPGFLAPIILVAATLMAMPLQLLKIRKKKNNESSLLVRVDEKIDTYSSYVKAKLDKREEKLESQPLGRYGVLAIEAVLYISSLAMIVSGYILMQSIPRSSLMFGSPSIFGGLVAASGIVMLLAADRYRRHALSTTAYAWLVGVMVIVAFLPFGEALKEGAPTGSDTAWILLFASPIAALAGLGVRYVGTPKTER